MAIFAAGMAVAILVLLGLTKTILQPISTLTRHVRDIRQTGDLSKRIYLTTKDEIGLLAKECDAMIARIEQITRENMEISARLRKKMKKEKQKRKKSSRNEKWRLSPH
ncbi:MAG: methyl-accepting chemotaxis protein [Desulfobacterales bacterium]